MALSKPRTQQSINAEEKFRKKVIEKGGILRSHYVDSNTKVVIECIYNHVFEAQPKHIVGKKGTWCTMCPSGITLLIHEAFTLIVNLNNGKILDVLPKNTSTDVRVQCERNHIWSAKLKVVSETTCWCPECDEIDGITFENNLMSTIALRDGSLLSKFNGKRGSTIQIICSEDHIFDRKASDILKGHWCSVCFDITPKNAKKKFLETLEKKGGTLLSEYKNSGEHVTIKCSSDHIWSTAPSNITSKDTWCPKCPKAASIEAKRKFIEKVESKGGKLKTEYEGIHTHVTVICSENHEFTVEPNSIMSMDTWCRKCSGNCPEQAAQFFYDYIKSMRGEIHEGKYTHAYGDVTIKCEFDHLWTICPHFMMTHYSWCPTCNESSGERHTRFVLEKYGVPFTSQKVIPALPKCKYDFHFVHNGQEFFIEYDGEQHFRRIDFFSKSEEDFQRRREIDITKTKEIQRLGHNLIRLDYLLTTTEQVETHILNAVQSGKKLYVSNEEKYLWLTEKL
jgi:hypothetical protein